jgi:hypothetical protein
MLTTPAAANAQVHLLHFIFVPPAMYGFIFRFYAFCGANCFAHRTKNGAIGR